MVWDAAIVHHQGGDDYMVWYRVWFVVGKVVRQMGVRLDNVVNRVWFSKHPKWARPKRDPKYLLCKADKHFFSGCHKSHGVFVICVD